MEYDKTNLSDNEKALCRIYEEILNLKFNFNIKRESKHNRVINILTGIIVIQLISLISFAILFIILICK
jgi:hypothetical protein